jgi:hypothetical protein
LILTEIRDCDKEINEKNTLENKENENLYFIENKSNICSYNLYNISKVLDKQFIVLCVFQIFEIENKVNRKKLLQNCVFYFL